MCVGVLVCLETLGVCMRWMSVLFCPALFLLLSLIVWVRFGLIGVCFDGGKKEEEREKGRKGGGGRQRNREERRIWYSIVK